MGQWSLIIRFVDCLDRSAAGSRQIGNRDAIWGGVKTVSTQADQTQMRR